MEAIAKKGRLVFHIGGDTGGVNFPINQQLVVDHMERDFKHDPKEPAADPAFLYVLGDCVYFNGQGAEYFPQFYRPYEHYLAPIFAVPGNHDGDPKAPEKSLDAFMRNFCAKKPIITPDAGEGSRDAMTQPNAYWTLETPLVNLVGLYTNVPEHGRLDEQQIAWLVSELKGTPSSKPLFLTMHHPIYSADDHHAGSGYMRGVLEKAVKQAGRRPDIVFAGHVHNYQRFTRVVDGRQVPYIVAGAGGYWHLHRIAPVNGERLIVPYRLVEDGNDVTLERFVDDRHGFLRVEVTPKAVFGKYYTVPRPQESWSADARLVDSFQLNLQTHKLV